LGERSRAKKYQCLVQDSPKAGLDLEVVNLPDGSQVRVRQYVWSDMHRSDMHRTDMHRTDEPYGEIGPMHIGPIRITKRYKEALIVLNFKLMVVVVRIVIGA